MYCLGDPLPKTVSGQAHKVLGVNMKDYVFEDMWAGPPKYDGIYDVEDFITGMVRTEGPTITLNGAWAQNIGAQGQYVDFIGSKAGIRLQYAENFTIYGVKDGKLVEEVPDFEPEPMFQKEIDSFLRCIQTGEKLPSHIDTVVITARIMQALYDSAEQGREIVLA
jgi:predicted dehydrogenase